MKDLFIYHLEVACCLASFYLFYMIFLKKDLNFNVKRLFIVFIGILAFILPAINFNYNLTTGETLIPVSYFTTITDQIVAITPAPVSANEMDPWLIFSWIWGIGFVIMVLRLLISLFHVYKILKEAVPASDKNKFRITYQGVQSFSFFRTIVLNDQHFQSDSMKYILAHEKVHSNQYHSSDVLFIELLKSFQWFNPFAWLFAGEALKNLEYLADREVVASLSNAKEYQLAIVQLAHRPGSRLLRTEFSKSNLKNRINMMNQPDNQKVHAGKFLLLFPIIAALFMSFSMKIDNLDLRKEISQILPVLDVTKSKIKEPINPTFIKNQLLNGTENKFHSSGPDEVDSRIEVLTPKDDPLHSASGNRSNYSGSNQPKDVSWPIQNEPKRTPDVQRGDNAMVKIEIPVSHGIQNNQDSLRTIKGRVITEDGKVFPGANIVVKGTNIGTVSDKYGNFVLEVSPGHRQLIIFFVGMNKNIIDIQNANEFVIILVPTSENKEVQFNGKNGIIINEKGKLVVNEKDQPLYIVDDKEMSPDEIRSIDPTMISRIDVLKDSAAVAKYGEKAKYGVLIITLK